MSNVAGRTPPRDALTEDCQVEGRVGARAGAVSSFDVDGVWVSVPVGGADLTGIRVKVLSVGSPKRSQQRTTRDVAIERHLVGASRHAGEQLRDSRDVAPSNLRAARCDYCPERGAGKLTGLEILGQQRVVLHLCCG